MLEKKEAIQINHVDELLKHQFVVLLKSESWYEFYLQLPLFPFEFPIGFYPQAKFFPTPE